MQRKIFCMISELVSPSILVPNPWNTNKLTPEAELKLELSITRFGMFKPIVARQLPDGTRQILGGSHRAAAATRMGLLEIPVVNLGEVPDDRAKEIGLVDNGRYGHDDATAIAALLNELGNHADLASFMPFDLNEIDAMTAIGRINLDDLGLDLDAEDAAPVEKPVRAAKTHQVMRVKVPMDDVSTIENQLKAIIKDQGLEDSDSLVNAGDALVWLVREYIKLSAY